MSIRKDDNGQMSIDFLVGVTIFILAFLFVMMAIPKLFTPFQSNSDQLTMMADRVAATLVESELVATDTAGQPLPGIIDSSKVLTLKSKISDASGNNLETPAAIQARILLGLSKGDPNLNPSNPNSVYHIQIELDEYDPYPNGGGLRPADIFPSVFTTETQIGSQNVGQSRRFVYLRDPMSMGDSTRYWPGVRTVMVVRVW